MLTHETPLPVEILSSNKFQKTSHLMDSSEMLMSLLSLAQESQADENQKTPSKQLASKNQLNNASLHIIPRNTLRILLATLRDRHEETVLHSRRVAALAVGLASNLGWEAHDKKVLEVACLLHDIGKMGIPDQILFKPGKLNADEIELMSLHHNIGIDVLQACQIDLQVIELIAQSNKTSRPLHESNQEDHRKTEQGAKILAVADAYDSLNHDQVFRPAKTHDEALEILHKESGTRFDSSIVTTLARWIENDGFPPSRRQKETVQSSLLGQVFSQLFMVENLYDGFFLLDENQQFVVWNLGAEQLLGQTARTMLGTKWSQELLGYSQENGNPLSNDHIPLIQAINQKKTIASTVHLQKTDGQLIELEIQTVPLIDSSGKLQGTAEFFRDVNQQTTHGEYQELKIAASRDSLTSVANRGELESQLQLMFDHYNTPQKTVSKKQAKKQAKKEDTSHNKNSNPFSVIFIDIDFFKNINDTFGHAVGDQVLIEFAQLLQRETYSGELVARYGGEEFVIICPATNVKQAHDRAERLRTSIQNTDIAGIVNYHVTASFGVAEIESNDTLKSLLKRADEALYCAKNTGRNRTMSQLNIEQAQQQLDAENQTNTDTDKPFYFTTTFHACLAAEMADYKLRSFVTENKAKLLNATETTAQIQVGSRRLFSYWGSTENKQPVTLTITFNHSPQMAQSKKTGSLESEITAVIEPIGIVRDAEIFRQRANQVARLLRAYFVAN